MSPPDPVRRHLLAALDWEEARIPLQVAFAEVPVELRGRVPEGLPYSLWQLLEHIRRAQLDLVEFCRNPAYQHPDWPTDYWPSGPEPPSPEAWEQSLEAYREDLEALKGLVADSDVDLAGSTPTGTARQTFLRAALLAIDHSSYHVGQAVVARRLLGIWPESR